MVWSVHHTVLASVAAVVVAVVSVGGVAASSLEHAAATFAGARDPNANHWRCKHARDGVVIDLGEPVPCALGRCVTYKGQQLSEDVARARCEGGKL